MQFKKIKIFVSIVFFYSLQACEPTINLEAEKILGPATIETGSLASYTQKFQVSSDSNTDFCFDDCDPSIDYEPSVAIIDKPEGSNPEIFFDIDYYSGPAVDFVFVPDKVGNYVIKSKLKGRVYNSHGEDTATASEKLTITVVEPAPGPRLKIKEAIKWSDPSFPDGVDFKLIDSSVQFSDVVFAQDNEPAAAKFMIEQTGSVFDQYLIMEKGAKSYKTPFYVYGLQGLVTVVDNDNDGIDEIYMDLDTNLMDSFYLMEIVES